MHLGSWKSTRETFKWHEAKPNASLASRVLSQLPKCILNSIDAQLKACANERNMLCQRVGHSMLRSFVHHVGLCCMMLAYVPSSLKPVKKIFPIYANISFV